MQTTFKNLKISSTFKGDKKANWNDPKFENWNNHIITVRNQDTKQATRFDFWASIAQPQIESETDILNALYCFVGDAVSGNTDFTDFCNEFGYDEDSRTAYKTYKACVRANEKLARVYNDDIYELANELQEMGF